MAGNPKALSVIRWSGNVGTRVVWCTVSEDSRLYVTLIQGHRHRSRRVHHAAGRDSAWASRSLRPLCEVAKRQFISRTVYPWRCAWTSVSCDSWRKAPQNVVEPVCSAFMKLKMRKAGGRHSLTSPMRRIYCIYNWSEVIIQCTQKTTVWRSHL